MTHIRKIYVGLRAALLRDNAGVVRWFLRHVRRRVDFHRKMQWDLFPYPHYAYGIHQSQG